MQTTPFLTDLDARAVVKGSRDPLGIQAVWTRLGRHLVGNLTTVSNSVRDFTTLLLGYHFAKRLAQDLGPGSELSTFLKWEQLAGYARAAANGDYSFRGTERVRKNLSEGPRVYLSDDRRRQILGNQKIYGLWGLYTMPARSSGLVDGDPPRLTPPAAELVERTHLPALEAGAGRRFRRLEDLLRQKECRIDVRGADAALIAATGKVLGPLSAPEREFYRFHLLHGGPTDSTGGRQQQLADLLTETLGDEGFAWSPAAVGHLAKAARSRGGSWHGVAHRLHRVRTAETVLAPAAELFSFLLGLDGAPADAVAARLRDGWGSGLRTVAVDEFRELREELGGGDAELGDRWVGVAESLAGGDYARLLGLLVEQNRSVMTDRGGASWVEMRDGRLHVRVRDEQGRLPGRDELPGLWRFSYFLDSLRAMAAALRERRRD